MDEVHEDWVPQRVMVRFIECLAEARDTGGGAAVVGEKGRRLRPSQRWARLWERFIMATVGKGDFRGITFAVITGRGKLLRLGRSEMPGGGVTKKRQNA